MKVFPADGISGKKATMTEKQERQPHPWNRWRWRACCEKQAYKQANKQKTNMNNNVPSNDLPRVQKVSRNCSSTTPYFVLQQGLQFAYCTVCKSDFSIAHGGKNDSKKHCEMQSWVKWIWDKSCYKQLCCVFQMLSQRDLLVIVHASVLIDLGHSGVFCCVFIRRHNVFCWAVDFNKNVCGNYSSACVHLLWIQVFFNLLFCCWFDCFWL